MAALDTKMREANIRIKEAEARAEKAEASAVLAKANVIASNAVNNAAPKNNGMLGGLFNDQASDRTSSLRSLNGGSGFDFGGEFDSVLPTDVASSLSADTNPATAFNNSSNPAASASAKQKNAITVTKYNAKNIENLFGLIKLDNYVNTADESLESYINEIRKLSENQESRLRFAALRELRTMGEVVGVDKDTIFGFILEVKSSKDGTDIVAAYADGRARVVDPDGTCTEWEPVMSTITEKSKALVRDAEQLFINFHEWKDSRDANLQEGYCRLTALTGGGFKILEGEYTKAVNIPQTKNVINNAFNLRKIVKTGKDDVPVASTGITWG